MAAGNTLEAVLGVLLLRRFARARGSLDRVHDVAGFVVLVAGLSTMVSATIGVTSGWLGGVIPAASAGKAWISWWLGDVLGDLVLAPLLFVWIDRPRLALSPWRLVEAGALLGWLMTATLLVFGTAFTPGQAIFLQPYVLFPLLIWAALRFGQHGSVLATFVVAAMAIWRTATGLGPFAMGTLNESLVALQLFMGVVAVTMLFFAAGVTERRRADRRARMNHSVARVLADAPTLEEVMPGILGAICNSMEWDCGNVWTADSGTGTLRHAAGWHRPGGALDRFERTAAEVSFPPGVGMAGRVWAESRPIWVPDIASEANIVRAQVASDLGLRSGVGFPILLGREVYGVMTFFSRRVQAPDEELLQTMAGLGSQIGQFIQRRRAEEDLRLAHADLEIRIARRTEQLSGMNLALKEEIAERRQAEESLRQLSTRLLRVQDEERQRLARELHDSTAQSLAGLSLNLAVVHECRAALGDRARDALDETEVLADRCSREIRSLSYLLHPPLLEEVGLPAALRWCADGFARRSGIAVDLDIPADFGRLPVEIENALFRIVQECLTNIQRHSGSPTARIHLLRKPRRVALEVRDRGHGMPAGILAGGDTIESLGVGLLGMRERVRQLGGRLRIDSNGNGSTVQVEIGLAAEGG
jgi:signal transduction histidine kinase